jgi:hypothetical protein
MQLDARRFAQGSVIALSGFVVAGIGCSSSDETPADGSSSSSSGGDTSSSSSSGGKTSSSSSGAASSSGASANCNPIGTFAFTKAVYTSGGGHVCDTLTTQSNNGGVAINYAYTKETDGTYSQADADDAKAEVVTMNLDAAGCVLKGDRAPITGSAKDDDGNPVNIVLKETDTVTITGDKAEMKGTATITSNPPGGKGLPCTVTFTSSGTRK